MYVSFVSKKISFTSNELVSNVCQFGVVYFVSMNMHINWRARLKGGDP